MILLPLSYLEVKNKISEFGYNLISRKYKNARTKLVVSDADGYLYYSTYGNLYSSRKPMFVSKLNPFSIKNFRTYFKNHNLRSDIMSVHLGDRITLTLRCKCGVVYDTDWCRVYGRHKDVCNRCSLKDKGENRRHSIDFIKCEYVKRGYKPLFDSYYNCEHPIPCEDADGYRGMLSYRNLKTGYSFGVFRVSNPYIIYNMDLFVEKSGFECRVATRSIGNIKKLEDAKIKVICACGNEYNVNWINFMSQHIYRCRKCSRKQSSYEYKTKKHLDSFGVEYIEEHRFDTCRNKLALPFDFAVINNHSVVLLIEVDGRQHYKNKKHPEALVSQKERDL